MGPDDDGDDNVDVDVDVDADNDITGADVPDIGAVVAAFVGNTADEAIVDSSSSSSNTCIGKSGNVGGGVLERRRSINNGVGVEVALAL